MPDRAGFNGGQGSCFAVTVPMASRDRSASRPILSRATCPWQAVVVIDNDPLVLDGMGACFGLGLRRRHR
jgi:hypothetical protein